MKNVSPPLLFSLLCLYLISISCKTQRKIEKADIKRKNASYLLAKLEKNELSYNWLSARAATNIQLGEQKLQMTMKVRVRKDSAIWLSISPALGIEMARVLITKDSLKFLNRLEKKYVMESIGYLDNFSPVTINYKMFQALLTGNNIVTKEESGTEKPDKYKAEIDDGKYLLSTLKMKKYNKTVKGKKNSDAAVNRIWLEPKTFKISKSEINNFKSNKKIIASYEQFEPIEGHLLARLVNVVIESNQQVSVALTYSKVTLNKPLKMPFRIPSKYEPLK